MARAGGPWSVLAALAVLVASAGVAGALGSPGPATPGRVASPSSPLPPPTTAVPTPTTIPATGPPVPIAGSVTLPSTAEFDQVVATAGGVLLDGSLTSSPQSNPTCVDASVNPVTLALGPVTDVGCQDPRADGETVGFVNAAIPGTNNATVAIATVDEASETLTTGPVVLTYGSLSDTRPVSTEGGGALWLYDVETTDGSEALEVSASTGVVLATVPMPQLYRPLLAANDAGLWIGNSIEGSPNPDSLYLVSPSGAVTDVIGPGSALCWLTADEDAVWAGVVEADQGCVAPSVWKFHGDSTSPAFVSPPSADYALADVVGDEEDGLWAVQWSGGLAPFGQPQANRVLSIDPDSGAESVLGGLPATPPPLAEGYSGQPATMVVFDGSLYLLEPPPGVSGYHGYTSLVRIALPARPGG